MLNCKPHTSKTTSFRTLLSSTTVSGFMFVNDTYTWSKFTQCLSTLKSSSTRFLHSDKLTIFKHGSLVMKHKVDTLQLEISNQYNDIALLSFWVNAKSMSDTSTLNALKPIKKV